MLRSNETTARSLRGRTRPVASQGYQTTRQTGSHMRLTTVEHGEHHVTIPNHDPIKVGTLAGILGDVAAHFEVSREQLIQQLFG